MASGEDKITAATSVGAVTVGMVVSHEDFPVGTAMEAKDLAADRESTAQLIWIRNIES